MSYQLRLTNRAISTFESISIQIFDRWGYEYVIDFEERVLKVFELLSDNPFMFKAIIEDNKVRKGFIHRNCAVFYEIKEWEIQILFFWDNRQDPIFR